MIINGRIISDTCHPYIIAEISANHSGSLQNAKDCIYAAKQAGVAAVKLQTYSPETMTIECEGDDFLISGGLWGGKTLFELYREAHTPFDWHAELFAYARSLGVTIFSTPFDETAVDLLESLSCPAYKVASFEIKDLTLLRYIARKQKPMIVSTGMATMSEIANALEVIKVEANTDVALLHCISSYPAPIASANLRAIELLKKEFRVPIGLSDHTIGATAAIAATSLGANIIEKHFTLSRKIDSPDSSFSAEPHEMSELVASVRDAHDALGTVGAMRSSVEDENKIFRRSLYFVKDISIGEEITELHVRRIRPGFGLDAGQYDEVIGSKCIKPAQRGDRVTIEHFRRG